MALWRAEDSEVFAATIAAAAERLGVQSLAVEKDYWICEVLRTMVASLDPAGEFAADLRREHETAMETLYYGSNPPSFDDVIDRVRHHAELLNPYR
ncbi:hypothetical protein H7J87_12065 [Mycolicibacterium wolinskyi]|uniref:Uncharacterized protein n=1 Tax=Mycolicibacterium wolinskyi TaxID=59750 RepID=A0A1X2FJ59_9MYCO|nr:MULTISPECIES: hypothetical protein [Mycolicibacterium]MCV7286067.1 hypothetical protein [Mycolicibacterium wolinskyi]MCV7296263.1 hypothetical protein [Mycolicibacterium goodii]ORX18490.1 hypothetical protein AWC31_14405 [Mycolicibacterium wolinskyi]